MTTATTIRKVSDALAEVARWKGDESTRQKAELAEVEQEVANLRQAIENLQQQLDALAKFKEEIEGKGSGLDSEEIQRTYKAIFDALQHQSAELTRREQIVAEAEQARIDALPESLKASEVASLVEEYDQFKSAVEPTLPNLPESYRSVILEHHETVRTKLGKHVRGMLSGPVELGEEPLEVEIVYAVDAPEGQPELVILVLPVSDQVHSGWLDREEGLQMWVAGRTIQALYQSAAEAGLPGAQAMCGGHLGLLAVEMELVGAGAEVVEVLKRRLAEALAAPEIAAAKVSVSLQEVDVDYLLPPDEEEDDAE